MMKTRQPSSTRCVIANYGVNSEHQHNFQKATKDIHPKYLKSVPYKEADREQNTESAVKNAELTLHGDLTENKHCM